MKKEGNSPSNIRTGWNQKFFYKVEHDGMLDNFIKLFVKNGNEWSMKKELFDRIVAEEKITAHHSFETVYLRTLEVDGEFIRFQNHVIEHLLTYNWKWSARNTWKNWKRVFTDAWAFVADPEARKISNFKYPNGAAMSVRCARKQGLIK